MTAALALALLLAQGGAAVALLGVPRRSNTPLRLGLAFAVGLAVHGASAFLLSIAGIVPRLGIDAGLAVVLAAAALVLRRRHAASEPTPHPKPVLWSPIDVALLLLLTMFFVQATAVALLEPIADWDTLAIWAFKAKHLAAAPLAGSDFLRDPAIAYAHLDYPLLWPFALASDPAFADPAALAPAKLFGPAVLAAIAALLYGYLAPRRGRTAGLGAAAIVVGLPMAAAQAARLLADLPLALFFLVAVGSISSALADDDPAAARLAGVALGALPLVKNEGIAVALALLAVGLVAARGRRRRLAAQWLVTIALLAGPWLVYRATLPKLHHNSELDLSPQRFVAQIDRLPEIARGSLDYFVAFDDWGIFWPAVATIALVAAVTAGIRRRAAAPGMRRPLLGWLVVAPAPIYLAALVANAWEPARLLEWSFARLLLQFAPAVTYWLLDRDAAPGTFTEPAQQVGAAESPEPSTSAAGGAPAL